MLENPRMERYVLDKFCQRRDNPSPADNQQETPFYFLPSPTMENTSAEKEPGLYWVRNGKKVPLNQQEIDELYAGIEEAQQRQREKAAAVVLKK